MAGWRSIEFSAEFSKLSLFLALSTAWVASFPLNSDFSSKSLFKWVLQFYLFIFASMKFLTESYWTCLPFLTFLLISLAPLFAQAPERYTLRHLWDHSFLLYGLSVLMSYYVFPLKCPWHLGSSLIQDLSQAGLLRSKLNSSNLSFIYP